MTDETTTGAGASSGELVRSIDWKQGLIIAMGIPILIVPSICDLSVTLWGMSIAVWTLSVLSGFLVNIPLGELCATFGVAGIGGSIQHYFKNDEKYEGKRVNWGRMIGSYGAWSYFITWVPVIPIFTIMTGDYLFGYFDIFAGIEGTTKMLLYLAIGAAIYGFIIFNGRKGLEGGAKAQLILSVVTIIPILIIVLVPLFTGAFHLNVIVDEFTPTGWQFDGNGILMILGCFTVAQWSAVAWESAATYGAEYKDPSKDVPKALMLCGLVCLFMYFVISFFVYGTLGIEGIINAPSGGAATLIPVAISDFGEIGGAIAVVLLIAGMVMIIQTAFLGAARTIQIMAKDGNLPMMFAKTNSYGVPMNAMYFEMAIGFILIFLGITASQILAVSALGFSICFGLLMYVFIKSRTDVRFKDVERKYKAPKWAIPGAYFMLIFEFFFMTPGLLYYVWQLFGLSYVFIGILTSVLYIPCWMVLQWWNTQTHPEVKTGMVFAKDANPMPKLVGIFTILGGVIAFLCVLGDWCTIGMFSYTGLVLMDSSFVDGFVKFIPVLTCVLGVLICVAQSVNFFLPRRSSKAISAVSLLLSVVAIAVTLVFATSGSVGIVEGSCYIALGGFAFAAVTSAYQMYGIINGTDATVTDESASREGQ